MTKLQYEWQAHLAKVRGIWSGYGKYQKGEQTPPPPLPQTIVVPRILLCIQLQFHFSFYQPSAHLSRR